MTTKLPCISILDVFLKYLGKKRGVKFPDKIYQKHGQYTYAKAKKESFLTAFFRSKKGKLPNGYLNLYDLIDLDDKNLQDKIR